MNCDAVYTERNRLVASLSKLFPSFIVHDRTQEEGWENIVYVQGPAGQMSWHIPVHDLKHFRHLFATSQPETPVWDGHTTEEKYERLDKIERVW